ncbi:MAG: flagellar hook capping FlgD N-terminal domain-containing protein [Phycisphaeraceae bacterium]
MTSMISSAATGAQNRPDAASQVAGRNPFGEMSSSDFIRVLVTELTTQDPFEPNDSQQILEQISSLRNIESQTTLQAQLQDLVMQNELTQAGGMIGRMVEGITPENDRIAGLVTAVRVVEGRAVLELDTGKSLPMGGVERVMNPTQPTET